MASANFDDFSEFSRVSMGSSCRGYRISSTARICSKWGHLHSQFGANHGHTPEKNSPSSHTMNGFSSRWDHENTLFWLITTVLRLFVAADYCLFKFLVGKGTFWLCKNAFFQTLLFNSSSGFDKTILFSQSLIRRWCREIYFSQCVWTTQHPAQTPTKLPLIVAEYEPEEITTSNTASGATSCLKEVRNH